MSNFRPIRPLPTLSADDDGDQDRPRKKRAIIAQACQPCRKHKVKCDGSRPKCQACVTKGRECLYDGEEGQSRPAAMKSRIESLEKLVDRLQTDKSGRPNEETSSDGHVACSSQPSIKLSFPNASLTQLALDGFFSCSGKLFHVFSEEQASQIFSSVFQNVDQFNSDSKPDICCLMAIAAVGFQYTQDQKDREHEEVFYNLAKLHLDNVIEERPLDAIKVCTLLGMYNIFKKATASLAYVDIGLGMCNRFGLDCERRQVSTLTDSVWSDYRKTWRTLIFFSTWLSATLGYKSGCEVVERISPSQFEIGDSTDISEIVQTEMVKIAMLKAHILQMHLAFKDITLLAVQSIMQDLQNWYDRMPQEMNLDSLGRENLPPEAKRSICHVHLLYLGANMLLFRRIASQMVRSSVGQGVLWRPCEKVLTEQRERALLAARSSARIVKLLVDDNAVFKRCWLVIFQTYTSCVIILHGVSQKQAEHLDPSTWKEDMGFAELCLAVLEFCGSLDPVAAKFYQRLSNICRFLLSDNSRDVSATTETSSPPETNEPISAEHTSVTTEEKSIYSGETLPDPSSPSRSQLSRSQLPYYLLELLCRPFGDLAYKEITKESLASEYVKVDIHCSILQFQVWHRHDPTRYEHPQLVERLDWDFENKAPFEWDPQDLGINSLVDKHRAAAETTLPGPYDLSIRPNHFLDSAEPSGWASNG
ncbi:hypothetical protein F4677DRAFT_465486 [Hypoxylon crocopeplum]|nr:hypothetical protein F4677DRAFT_465486 [Hypoxylon crocopeplum]